MATATYVPSILCSPRSSLCSHVSQSRFTSSGNAASMFGDRVHCFKLPTSNQQTKNLRAKFIVRAAKLPSGVSAPKEEPKLTAPFFGFTTNAEVWNSRAAMLGIFGVVILEAIVHRGLLDLLGIEIGKGLDLPL